MTGSLVWISWRFSFSGASSLFKLETIRCGCIRVLTTPLGFTRRRSMTTHWRGGCRASPETRTTPGEPGEFLHSTSPMNQKRSDSELLIILRRLTLFFLLSFRPLSKCTQCPTESKSKTRKERRAAATVANGILTEKGTKKATTQVTKKKSSRLLAGRGDPSLTKNGRVLATRQLLRLVSLRSTLGSLHQPRLRRRQSTQEL